MPGVFPSGILLGKATTYSRYVMGQYEALLLKIRFFFCIQEWELSHVLLVATCVRAVVMFGHVGAIRLFTPIEPTTSDLEIKYVQHRLDTKSHISSQIATMDRKLRRDNKIVELKKNNAIFWWIGTDN